MKNILMELSRVLMNPIVQAALAHVVANHPVPPPIEPPIMEATMQISEELERQEMKATKEMEEEADDYHEHL